MVPTIPLSFNIHKNDSQEKEGLGKSEKENERQQTLESKRLLPEKVKSES